VRPVAAAAAAIASALITGSALADDQRQHASESAAAESSVSPARDDSNEAPGASEVTVSGERPSQAASAVTVTGGELKVRPRLRPADIVETVPGLFAVQHAGGGKANQYFLRGFDIDHGTDLALYVDGVPVNMPSHGHGQGYSDLHFVIPELVTTLEGYKGPYYAEFGDFATAGAVNMRLASELPESQASLTLGQFGIARGLAIVSRDIGTDWKVLLAGEAYAQNGPFEHAEKLQRFNGVVRVTHDLSASSTVALTWMSNTGQWNASGQIPLREVEAGQLSQFGSVDPYEGGTTHRHALSLSFEGGGEDMDFRILAYGLRYGFDLFSDFTYFLADPVHGDMIEQTDDRTVIGLDARTSFHQHVAGMRFQTTLGLQGRADIIQNGLFHDFQRQRLSTTVDAGVGQTAIGFFAQEEARFTPWLTLTIGVRVDHAGVSVVDLRSGSEKLGGDTSGSRAAALASPKATLVLTPAPPLDLFLDFGRGFHSNDARGAVRTADRATLLVPATGYEVGTRVRPWKPLMLTAAVFRIDLDSEQVYEGDEGTTEPSPATTRTGAELGARLGFGRWLFGDVDATFTKAVYRENAGNGNAVALAPTRTLTGGIGFRTRVGTFGSLRVRHIGARPATEDRSITAEGWTVVDAQVGHRLGPFELALDVQNLFDTDWREVQFATVSRLATERAPVRDISFVPGWPRTVMGRLTGYF
jgi:outer membrane receptor for monomeric catechols